MKKTGFTLIELLVVMTVISLLMAIISPRYFQSISKAEESVLKQNLHLTRDAIDKYYSDNSKYPDNLQDLVTKKYLRQLPYDPITQSDNSWILITPSDSIQGRIFDIKSGATGKGIDGTNYADW